MKAFRFLGLAAVLGAGLLGLSLSDTQAGAKLSAGELKEVNAFLQKMIQGIDGIIKKAQDAKDQGVIIDTKLTRDFLDTQAVRFNVPSLNLQELQTLKANINTQLKTAIAQGRLTELDKKLLATQSFGKGTPFARKLKVKDKDK
jgi:hypothetical protein